MDNYVSIYTDGSCFNNGKKNATGAIGIFFADNDQRNTGLSIDNIKITNQTMEILACIKALELMPEKSKIYIYTDSKYVINAMTQWIKKWEECGWKTTNDKDVENKELLKELHNKIKANFVIFKHVESHKQQPNINSDKYIHWYGNYKADELAVNANRSNAKNKINNDIKECIKYIKKDINIEKDIKIKKKSKKIINIDNV